MLTHYDVLALLKKRAGGYPSVSAAARNLGLTQQQLEPVLAGRRGIGPTILKALRLRKVAMYQRVRRRGR